VSQNLEQPAGGGVMRRIAGNGRSVRFSGVLGVFDDAFTFVKSSVRADREEQRRRRVAVPAPGDPPSSEPVDEAIVALPTELLGPVLPEELSAAADGAAEDSPSARGEQPPPALDL
jgi:hypothetical protein